MQYQGSYNIKLSAKSYCGNESPSLGNAEPAPFDKGASGWCKFGGLYAVLKPHTSLQTSERVYYGGNP